MFFIKSIALLPLAVGTLALTHQSIAKRDILEARQTCTRTGWIPACPGVYKCVPPGAICCSDGITYAMPPQECPNGQSALTTAPLTLVTISTLPAPPATTETEIVSVSDSPTTEITETVTEVTESATETEEATVTEVTETATGTEEPTITEVTETATATEEISITGTDTGIVSVEPMPTDVTITEDVGTASWTVSTTPGLNATVTLGGPTGVVTAGAARVGVQVVGGLLGFGFGVGILL